MNDLKKAANYYTEIQFQATKKDWPGYADKIEQAFIDGANWLQDSDAHFQSIEDAVKLGRTQGEDYAISLLEHGSTGTENKEVLGRAATWLKRVLR